MRRFPLSSGVDVGGQGPHSPTCPQYAQRDNFGIKMCTNTPFIHRYGHEDHCYFVSQSEGENCTKCLPITMLCGMLRAHRFLS